MTVTVGLALAMVGLGFLIVGYILLRSAERRLDEAKGFLRQAGESLAEAKALNDTTGEWLQRL